MAAFLRSSAQSATVHAIRLAGRQYLGAGVRAPADAAVIPRPMAGMQRLEQYMPSPAGLLKGSNSPSLSLNTADKQLTSALRSKTEMPVLSLGRGGGLLDWFGM